MANILSPNHKLYTVARTSRYYSSGMSEADMFSEMANAVMDPTKHMQPAAEKVKSEAEMVKKVAKAIVAQRDPRTGRFVKAAPAPAKTIPTRDPVTGRFIKTAPTVAIAPTQLAPVPVAPQMVEMRQSLKDENSRRVAAVERALSYGIDESKPNVQRVMNEQSRMGQALAALYSKPDYLNKNAADMPGTENLPANVKRVIGERSGMGQALAALYSSWNLGKDIDKETEKHASVSPNLQPGKSSPLYPGGHPLRETIERVRNAVKNHFVERVFDKSNEPKPLIEKVEEPTKDQKKQTAADKKAEADKKRALREEIRDRKKMISHLAGIQGLFKTSLTFWGKLFNGLGKMISLFGVKKRDQSAMGNLGWAGALFAGRVALGGDKGNIFGDTKDMLPPNIKEMIDTGINSLRGLVGEENFEKYQPLMKNLLIGGSLGSLVGFTPTRMVGLVGDLLSGFGKDLMSGNLSSALMKGLGLGALGYAGFQYGNSETPVQDFKDDITKLVEIGKQTYAVISALWTAIKPAVEWATKSPENAAIAVLGLLAAPAVIAGLMSGIASAAVGALVAGGATGLLAPIIGIALAGASAYFLAKTGYDKIKDLKTNEDVEYASKREGLENYRNMKPGILKTIVGWQLRNQGLDPENTTLRDISVSGQKNGGRDADQAVTITRKDKLSQGTESPTLREMANGDWAIARGIAKSGSPIQHEAPKEVGRIEATPEKMFKELNPDASYGRQNQPIIIQQPTVVQGGGQSSAPNNRKDPANSPGHTSASPDVIDGLVTGYTNWGLF